MRRTKSNVTATAYSLEHAPEQHALFSEESLLSERLPLLQELQPANNLSALFDECHNYIYANEGLLKDKIFHEMVKLLVMKLYDEQRSVEKGVQFGVTASEYRDILANKPNAFQSRLSCLLDAIRDGYKGLIADSPLQLQPLTLAFVVQKLQYVNLSKTDGDVKGEAFQAFVNRHQRGDRGEFFTPHPIVRLAVEMLAPKPNERVIDPACGSGGFLIAALAYIQQNYPDASKPAYIQDNIAGIEFNPDVAFSAKLRLVFEGGAGAEILCANTLLESATPDNSFDVILTNPPFGSKGKVEDPNILKKYILARKWQKTQNSTYEPTTAVLPGQSPDVLFIEKCLNLLRPGGRMAIVLPDGILQNISSSHIRYWIRSQAKVLGVVSIPQEAFIPYGTGIKTSLLLLQKFPSDANQPCFMARIEKIGYDVKGQPIYKRNSHGKPIANSAGRPIVDDDIAEIAKAFHTLESDMRLSPQSNIYTVSEAKLNSRLHVEYYHPDDQVLLEHLRSIGAKPLGEIAHILTATDDFRLSGDSEIRYIAISDVDSRTMQVVFQQTLKAHEAPSRATYRLCKDDIITAASGASTGTSRQATALITEDEAGAICSNGFAVIRDIQGIEPLFLLAYMRSEYYLRQVKRLMTGHAIPAISTEDLASVLVPIPNKQEQARIAASISQIQSIRREALKAGERIVSETNALVSKLR